MKATQKKEKWANNNRQQFDIILGVVPTWPDRTMKNDSETTNLSEEEEKEEEEDEEETLESPRIICARCLSFSIGG